MGGSEVLAREKVVVNTNAINATIGIKITPKMIPEIKIINLLLILNMVGGEGLEPPTSSV